jgi:hypothetical protein
MRRFLPVLILALIVAAQAGLLVRPLGWKW